MCPIVLEYGLKDLPCSTEWIDVHYKCIRNSVWNHYNERLCKRAQNSSFKKTLKLAYLSLPFINDCFLPVNATLTTVTTSHTRDLSRVVPRVIQREEKICHV